MMGSTHFLAGAVVGATVGMKTGNILEGAALGGFAALLPDVDHPGSIVGKLVRPVAVVLEAISGHRSITHTIWFCLVTSLALAALFSNLGFFWILFLGSFSHIMLDSLTRSGTTPIPPLPFHPRGPFTTGNILTEGVISALAVFMLIKILSISI